jgi:hypothetical protein
MKILADFVQRVRGWPLIPRLAFQLWMLAALAVLVDFIFSLGLIDAMPAWLAFVCGAPVILFLALALIGSVQSWRRRMAGLLGRRS